MYQEARHTDLGTRIKIEFKNGGMEPKRLCLQNASPDTNAFVKFKADDGVVPSINDFTVVVPSGGVMVSLEDISVQVMISSPVVGLSVFRY